MVRGELGAEEGRVAGEEGEGEGGSLVVDMVGGWRRRR